MAVKRQQVQARRWVRRSLARVAKTLASWWLDKQRGNFQGSYREHQPMPRAPLIGRNTVWGQGFYNLRAIRAENGVGRPPAVTLARWGRRAAA